MNFTIQEEGIEEQLLKTLISLENPGLEELKENIIIKIEKDKKSIIDIQDEILKMLDDNDCSLLENEQLLQTLKSSNTTLNIIKEKLQNSLSSQTEINMTREV